MPNREWRNFTSEGAQLVQWVSKDWWNDDHGAQVLSQVDGWATWRSVRLRVAICTACTVFTFLIVQQLLGPHIRQTYFLLNFTATADK
eukprot:gene3282-1459_t